MVCCFLGPDDTQLRDETANNAHFVRPHGHARGFPRRFVVLLGSLASLPGAGRLPRRRRDAREHSTRAHRPARRVLLLGCSRGVGVQERRRPGRDQARVPPRSVAPRLPPSVRAEQVRHVRHPARKPRRGYRHLRRATRHRALRRHGRRRRRGGALPRAPPPVHLQVLRGGGAGTPTTDAGAHHGRVPQPGSGGDVRDDTGPVPGRRRKLIHRVQRLLPLGRTVRVPAVGRTQDRRAGTPADRGDGPSGDADNREQGRRRVCGVPEKDGEYHLRPAPHRRAAADVT